MKIPIGTGSEVSLGERRSDHGVSGRGSRLSRPSDFGHDRDPLCARRAQFLCRGRPQCARAVRQCLSGDGSPLEPDRGRHRGDHQRAARHCVPDPDWGADRPDPGEAGRHRPFDFGNGLRLTHHLWPPHVLADGGRVCRSGDRGRRLCACGRRVDPRGHAQVRPRPASRPELGVRSCREHRDCNRCWRDRICAFAARGLPDGPGLRNIDHGGGPQHPRERHQSGPRERCGR